jgi:hypothetical protein
MAPGRGPLAPDAAGGDWAVVGAARTLGADFGRIGVYRRNRR